MAKRPLFLDRDGVINKRLKGDYVRYPHQFVFENRALDALRTLAELFYPIIVVSNQAGVGKGLIALEDVEVVHQYMLSKVEDAGGRIDKVYFCPHHPEEGCLCRKPALGMAYRAQCDFPELIFEEAWMVGDSLSDMQMGSSLGMRTALILGKEEEAALLEAFPVARRFHSLWDFAVYCRAEASSSSENC
ncbi:MAG: HAD family hydrolase [Saprospiraceae bacterium]|nr:HAD family hydrolase [Saprospiraceae bacterium]MDW8484502.1 HAD family hydrolase [Saprospiraceae bacterium]